MDSVSKTIVDRAILNNIKGGDDGGSRCRTGGCTVPISQNGTRPGQCSTLQESTCICVALDFSASVVSSECRR